MECEKSPAATTFSTKITSRSHSLSFTANAVYDGVFPSPTNSNSSLVDYGDIFRGSGPSPSSIPFLDVPELNVGKVKVDVRSSKLDYSSVFGGFGGCDFAVTPKEVIIKSEKKTAIKEDKKRNRRKSGNSSDVPASNEGKNSPEMVRMKHSDISHSQAGPRKEIATAQLTQAQVITMPFPSPSPTPLVDNTTPLQKIESKTPIPPVEKNPCNEVREEVVKASRKRGSKTEVELENVFARNECSTRGNFTCKSNSNAEHQDVKPPQSLQPTLNVGASQRLSDLTFGLSERFQTEDNDSPNSPPYFDAETDTNSAAAESSAALKKAIEEAQVRMNIAKQMMERNKSGFRSCAKLKSSDDPKVENKVDEKAEGTTKEIRDNHSQSVGEVLNSSEQSSLNEGDHHAKKARKLWGVPEGLLKPTSDHKREELEEQDLVKLEEEQARSGRKHWELPGGIFKSVMKSEQQGPENLAPAKPETDSKQEVQPSTETPFYTFGQLGSKIKCVVEAFTGSKVSLKDEKQVTEMESSTLTHMVHGKESDSQDIPDGIPVMETYIRELESPQQTESRSETNIEEKFISTTCTFTEVSPQKMETETGWQVKSACESESGLKCDERDFQEEPDLTYNVLDQEDEKDIVTGPQEMVVGPDDAKRNLQEVEEIITSNQSSSKTQFNNTVGAMVSFNTESTSEPGNIHEARETEHKAPRRRRVWKTSEDVYNMIKAPKGNNRPWQLESAGNEIIESSSREEGLKIHNASEETESTSGQASDSGLQENWTVLKQMFRQMFHTADTKGEDETYCLVESEKYRNGDGNGTDYEAYAHTRENEAYAHIEENEANAHSEENEANAHSEENEANAHSEENEANAHSEENEAYVHSEVNEAYVHTRENEELESAEEEIHWRTEDGKVEVQGKMSLVREMIGEELEATRMCSDQEGEVVHQVSNEAGWAQGVSDLNKTKEHAIAEVLEYDQCETDSNISGEKFEQTHELAEETEINGSVDTDTSRSSLEMRQGDSYIEEVGIEQDLSDHFPEKASAVSSTEEHVEEIDSDSIRSGWSVEDDDRSLHDGGGSQTESKLDETEETKEEADEMKTSLGVENNESKTEQEHHVKCQENDIDRSNVEEAMSSCCFRNGDEKIGVTTYINMKEDEGEESCRSSMEEEGDATSDASQNEAERVKEHLKKKDETREKEREREKERVMVERAIREARERAFADARERAEKAAMEKAKAGAHRKGTSEVPRRSEKGSVEVNFKLSSAEKASMQAKLRAERAAVERALAEARERAMEKALSSKAAASQARSYGGSKSFGSSGEKRGSSSSGMENKSTGPSNSSNQTAKAEPIQRCKARSERHQRTCDRAAEALAEKKLRDTKAQKEQAERNRLAEALDAEVKRWSSGKESNLRALLSTLQYILGAESGWKPIPLTDLVSSASVRKAYRKATLYVHPDKLQQRGASTQQKYICEKVFDLLKEAWNKFGADER